MILTFNSIIDCNIKYQLYNIGKFFQEKLILIKNKILATESSYSNSWENMVDPESNCRVSGNLPNLF